MKNVYVANNPIAYVDRNGKIIISALVVGIVVGAVVGGTTAGVRARANDENVVAAVVGGAVVGAAVGAFGVVAAPKVATVGGALKAATATSGASGGLTLANHQMQGMINHDDNQAPHITESLRAAGTAMITTFFGSLIAAPLGGAIDKTDALAPVAYTAVALFTDV